MTRTPVVDVWANWWPEDFFTDYPKMRGLYERFGLQDRATLTIDDIFAEATAGQLDKILLSATAFPGSNSTNSVVAAVVKKHPSLLLGCASVDPREGMKAVRDLRRAVEHYDFKALKLISFLYDKPPNDAIYYPLYAACVDLGIPVLILTGHTAVQRPNVTGRPEFLDDVALHFPELTIVAGHAGYPWSTELIALAWKHQNLYIDTSGHRPKHLPPELLNFLNSYGRHKVLFGTGYPMMDYVGPLAEARALDLKPGVLDEFLGENAMRALPGLAS
jgi:predicted TIM-barrel fold metal-dependent hydrolase